MTATISFLSDFGHQDEFVGVVHGVIARIAPEARVIDIGHDFPAGDVRTGGLALLRAIQYLPPGVALAVVDPTVGTSRRAIVAVTPWGPFVGPDNGLLAPAVAMVGGAGEIWAIENPEFRIPAEGATFQGRDVFAPVAALLAAGEANPADVGPEVDPASVTPLMIPLVEPDGSGGLLGEVLWVDRYGNCQTNVAPDDLDALGLAPGDDVVVKVGAAEHRMRWVTAYADVAEGELLLHIDSYGQMAIALRDGRADDEVPLTERMAVTFRRPAGGSRIPLTG